MEKNKSCLCCGKVGEPVAWLMNDHSVYVCRRCHRLCNTPDFEASTEEEGDAYTFGYFDGAESSRVDLQERHDKLLIAFVNARRALGVANEMAGGPIVDTIWYSDFETLFDFMDSAIEIAQGAS